MCLMTEPLKGIKNYYRKGNSNNEQKKLQALRLKHINQTNKHSSIRVTEISFTELTIISAKKKSHSDQKTTKSFFKILFQFQLVFPFCAEWNVFASHIFFQTLNKNTHT